MVTIVIETDNAAFRDQTGDNHRYVQALEVARILEALTTKIRDYPEAACGATYPLLDINGNRVGMFKMDVPED